MLLRRSRHHQAFEFLVFSSSLSSNLDDIFDDVRRPHDVMLQHNVVRSIRDCVTSSFIDKTCFVRGIIFYNVLSGTALATLSIIAVRGVVNLALNQTLCAVPPTGLIKPRHPYKTKFLRMAEKYYD